MNPAQSNLFDETNVSSRKLINRFVVAPMTRNSADENGVATAQMAAYYESFALGGFGTIITEGVFTDNLASKCNPDQPGIVTAKQLEGWKRVTELVKKSPAVFICQLMHAGALSQVTKTTLAPSAVKPMGRQMTSSGGSGEFPLPAEMCEEDIQSVIAGYVNAAQNAVEAGFDGIEIHAANGYLPDQFITSYSNKRTDAYGGSVENRFRFVAEIIQRIRVAVPVEFIVGLRLSEGKVNNLAYRWEEGPEMARKLFAEVKKSAPDYLHIAAEGGGWQRECLYSDGSSSTGIAKEMLDCPVIANGGLHDLKLAQELLSTEQADLISIGRYAIANPDFPVKVKHKQELFPFVKEMIDPCVKLTNTFGYYEQLSYNR